MFFFFNDTATTEIYTLSLHDALPICTKNREAWNAYIQGRHYLNRLSSDGLKQAIAFMQEAIRLDPDFALAYAELAEIYGWSGDQLFPNREAYIKMREAALKALQMDDSLAQAHKTLGYVVANVDRDFSKAEKELVRAIKLSPYYASAYEYYGWFLLEMGRLEDAKREFKQAQWLDPVSPRICCVASHPFFYNGEFTEAVEQLDKALDLDPNYAWAFELLVRLHEEKAEFQEAIAMFEKAAVAGGTGTAKAAQMSDEL